MKNRVGGKEAEKQSRQPWNGKTENELVFAVEIVRNPNSAH
jgi:hypothetical protein